jgi:hypothetical protein
MAPTRGPTRSVAGILYDDAMKELTLLGVFSGAIVAVLVLLSGLTYITGQPYSVLSPVALSCKSTCLGLVSLLRFVLSVLKCVGVLAGQGLSMSQLVIHSIKPQ